MRVVTLLGSTGTIGVSTLDVVAAHPDELKVEALATGSKWRPLLEQIRRFRPRLAVVFDPGAADELRRELGAASGCAVQSGMEGLVAAATLPGVDTLVSAVVGSIGLMPVMAAIEQGRTICLANKETLVVGGHLVVEAARRHGVEILPIDSEHSAIFQCLADRDRRQVRRLLLTASGGPFRHTPAAELAGVTPQQALKHPNWDMGGKITIDSATLMNKGLEVIEAHWLFGVPFAQIEVVVHPQSIVHSLVEFVDGSILAQMGVPDMRGPIQYALSHPRRWEASAHRTDLLALGPLTFEPPRRDAFPCLDLAYEAGRRGGTLPCVLNAANEVAVAAFLAGRVGFGDIPCLVRRAMDEQPHRDDPDLPALLACDQAVRARVAAWLPPAGEGRAR